MFKKNGMNLYVLMSQMSKRSKKLKKKWICDHLVYRDTYSLPLSYTHTKYIFILSIEAYKATLQDILLTSSELKEFPDVSDTWKC